MKKSFFSLYLEINNLNFVFSVLEKNENENFKIIYKLDTPLIGFDNNRISDLEKISDLIKENIYLIEKKFNFTFKEIILILDNFNHSYINLTGFKKLNGSQVLRENITYILNTLKSYVNEIDPNKTILHIFNSKFNLDNKRIDNLPIGLFGDFYSHELSFILINLNDFKNLKNIFDKCNLKIKKVLLKNFIKGAHISNKNKDSETFFHIQIKDNRSKIFYFEHNSLKFNQNFEFGLNIILKDISKITSLNIKTVGRILEQCNFDKDITDDELIEKDLFDGKNYRKIKKKLIYQIAHARIQEISEIILFKNINLCYYNKDPKIIFLEIKKESQVACLMNIFKSNFSKNGEISVKFLDSFSSDGMLNTASQIVHFGWKKEAIPIFPFKKSIISRFFDAIFG